MVSGPSLKTSRVRALSTRHKQTSTNTLADSICLLHSLLANQESNGAAANILDSDNEASDAESDTPPSSPYQVCACVCGGGGPTIDSEVLICIDCDTLRNFLFSSISLVLVFLACRVCVTCTHVLLLTSRVQGDLMDVGAFTGAGMPPSYDDALSGASSPEFGITPNYTVSSSGMHV